MRKNHTVLIFFMTVLLLAPFFTSCVKEDKYDGSRRGNFEAFWKLLDEHYCFFDCKQKELGVDWNEVHDRYSLMINEDMTQKQLFEVLCNMLSELKDGHVNLGSSFDYGHDWSWYEDYPRNYNDSIIDGTYLGTSCHIASGLRYVVFDDNIGYIRCESFANAIGSGNVSQVLDALALCDGVIIDVRSNGGGQITSAHTLASHFTNEKLLIGYSCHKAGPGHNDFSTPKAEYLEPASQGLRWQKKCIVLTNRQVFSAANDFVKVMKLCPNVTILGDRTGGGSGMPFTSELPIGWSVRYSAVVYFDKDMNHTEFGIDPDIPCSMNGSDTDANRDTFIETARQLLRPEESNRQSNIKIK